MNKEIEKKSPRPSAVPEDDFEPLLDSEEAAALLKIHPKTLQKMARRGESWPSKSVGCGAFALRP